MTFDSRSSSFSCDTCPESLDCDDRGFAEALEFAKSKGWRAYVGPDKMWGHSCPSCTEDWKKEQRR
jgi:hypothetical protein